VARPSEAVSCSAAARFAPAPICGGIESTGGGTGGLPIFQQPVRVCVNPKAGEPIGKSEGGKVCTWEMISGATEEGRHFEDYASCDRVRTQRPYYKAGTLPDNTRDDPRMKDPTYATEQAWVMSQVRSAACVCCHSTRAPQGPSNWFVDQPGNFLNGFFNRGLAMGAGLDRYRRLWRVSPGGKQRLWSLDAGQSDPTPSFRPLTMPGCGASLKVNWRSEARLAPTLPVRGMPPDRSTSSASSDPVPARVVKAFALMACWYGRVETPATYMC
jgi:hypothetical protein